MKLSLLFGEKSKIRKSTFKSPLGCCLPAGYEYGRLTGFCHGFLASLNSRNIYLCLGKPTNNGLFLLTIAILVSLVAYG